VAKVDLAILEEGDFLVDSTKELKEMFYEYL